MKRRLAAVFLVLALLSGIARAAERDVILGIMEEKPNLYGGPAQFFKVRIAFNKRGDKWIAVCTKAVCPSAPDLAAETEWSVGFSGRNLGHIPSPNTAHDEWTFDGNGIPVVGTPSVKFGGFPGVASHRPLIVSSHGRFMDPDGWKRGALPGSLEAALRVVFRRRFPKVEHCEKGSGDQDATPWKYSGKDIKTVKYYTSRTGWSVAAITLSPWRCDGPEDDAFTNQWFAISPEGEIKFLDQGIWLVDAGDYDADGKSELIFAIDRYNEGGYVLYYDDFARHATAEFHYH